VVCDRSLYIDRVWPLVSHSENRLSVTSSWLSLQCSYFINIFVCELFYGYWSCVIVPYFLQQATADLNNNRCAIICVFVDAPRDTA